MNELNLKVDSQNLLGFPLVEPFGNQRLSKGRSTITFQHSVDPSRDIITLKYIDKTRAADRVYLRLSKFFRLALEIQDNQSEAVLINIKNIQKNLGIPRKDLQTLFENGEAELKEYLFKRLFILQTDNLPLNLRDTYRSLFERFHFGDNQFFYPEDGTPTGLNPREAKQIIQEANEAQNKFPAKSKNSAKYWVNNAGHQICIVKKIGEGEFSKVYAYIDLKKQILGAFKAAKKNQFHLNQVIKDLQREFRLLFSIHANNKAWGIQVRPRKSLTLSVQSYQTQDDKAPKLKSGYIGMKYDYSYFDECHRNPKPPIEDILFEFHQILGGLCKLSQLNILHGDIKVDNILVKNTGKMKWIHLSDFQGAVRADDDLPLIEFVAGEQRKATALFNCLDRDENLGLDFAMTNNKVALIKLEKARDVYGTGYVLYYRLMRRFPLAFMIAKKLPIQDINEYHGLDVDGTLPELQDLIESMILEDYEARPSAEAVFFTFQEIINIKFPFLGEKIQAAMDEYTIV